MHNNMETNYERNKVLETADEIINKTVDMVRLIVHPFRKVA